MTRDSLGVAAGLNLVVRGALRQNATNERGLLVHSRRSDKAQRDLGEPRVDLACVYVLRRRLRVRQRWCSRR